MKTFLEKLQYIPRKNRRFFWIWSGVNLITFIGGVVMCSLGMYSGIYGFLLILTYLPFVASVQDMADVFSKDEKNLNSR